MADTMMLGLERLVLIDRLFEPLLTSYCGLNDARVEHSLPPEAISMLVDDLRGRFQSIRPMAVAHGCTTLFDECRNFFEQEIAGFCRTTSVAVPGGSTRVSETVSQAPLTTKQSRDAAKTSDVGTAAEESMDPFSRIIGPLGTSLKAVIQSMASVDTSEIDRYKEISQSEDSSLALDVERLETRLSELTEALQTLNAIMKHVQPNIALRMNRLEHTMAQITQRTLTLSDCGHYDDILCVARQLDNQIEWISANSNLPELVARIEAVENASELDMEQLEAMCLRD